MTTQGFAGRLRVDRPLVGRVGLRRFPRHTFGRYTLKPGDGWTYRDPLGHWKWPEPGRRYDAGWLI